MSADATANLLVIGAARAGTTALCRTLARHDQIYLTRPKESHFLAFAGRPVAFTGPGDDEMINRVALTDVELWHELCGRTGGQRYVCEGSVSTLFYHEHSIANVEVYAAPGVRLIVSLREPIDRAFSSYLYLLARGHETAPTFAAALALEDQRAEAGWHHLWRYRAMSHYGPQLTAFVDAFGRDSLFVFTHDEFRRRRRDLLTRLCAWLDLDPGPTLEDQGEVNVGGVPRSSAVQSAMRRVRSSALKPLLQRLSSERFRERVRTANLDRPELDDELRLSLLPEFGEDVAVVEELVGRRLAHWRV